MFHLQRPVWTSPRPLPRGTGNRRLRCSRRCRWRKRRELGGSEDLKAARRAHARAAFFIMSRARSSRHMHPRHRTLMPAWHTTRSSQALRLTCRQPRRGRTSSRTRSRTHSDRQCARASSRSRVRAVCQWPSARWRSSKQTRRKPGSGCPRICPPTSLAGPGLSICQSRPSTRPPLDSMMEVRSRACVLACCCVCWSDTKGGRKQAGSIKRSR